MPGYVCPLCVHAFPSIDDLSFEHAPPESVGGREVCLTCKSCNNTAGAGVDKELRRALDHRDWWRGTGKPVRARLEVAEITLRVEMQRTPSWSRSSHPRN